MRYELKPRHATAQGCAFAPAVSCYRLPLAASLQEVANERICASLA